MFGAQQRDDVVDLFDTRGAHGEERSEEHTSELQSPCNLVCRLLLEKKKITLRTAAPTRSCADPLSQQPPRLPAATVATLPARVATYLSAPFAATSPPTVGLQNLALTRRA